MGVKWLMHEPDGEDRLGRMKIDAHNHVIPERVLELLRTEPASGTRFESGRSLRGGGGFPIAPSFRDPHAKLAELEAKGLDGAVVSAAPPLFFYDVSPDAGEALCRATNEGLREFAAARPDRYRWMAHVPLAAPGRAPEVLAEAVADGAAGVEVGRPLPAGVWTRMTSNRSGRPLRHWACR